VLTRERSAPYKALQKYARSCRRVHVLPRWSCTYYFDAGGASAGHASQAPAPRKPSTTTTTPRRQPRHCSCPHSPYGYSAVLLVNHRKQERSDPPPPPPPPPPPTKPPQKQHPTPLTPPTSPPPSSTNDTHRQQLTFLTAGFLAALPLAFLGGMVRSAG